ncbi:hypothetical protein BLNAU_20867 [Blattamonas nauphoetae]|uniref:Uncharacterized protein n=1 Tax=Blattamonas nauphoetae TaxID=2049346 RepID=A0ABQ9WXG5_9EUKA|nr:hypothetical protein BLNAU_20867 [Blattamonas nauphoetae]
MRVLGPIDDHSQQQLPSTKSSPPIHQLLLHLVISTLYPTKSDSADQFSSFEQDRADKLVTDLVHSSDGSPSGFADSIVTLLSCPHLAVVEAALSFLFESICNSSFFVRHRLLESDPVTKVEWKTEGPEVAQSGKLMLQALISEGYEDTLEQKLLNNKNGHFGPIASLKLLHIHFCGLSSDAGNALIAGADEQILQSPPIVQKRNASRLSRRNGMCPTFPPFHSYFRFL